MHQSSNHIALPIIFVILLTVLNSCGLKSKNYTLESDSVNMIVTVRSGTTFNLFGGNRKELHTDYSFHFLKGYPKQDSLELKNSILIADYYTNDDQLRFSIIDSISFKNEKELQYIFDQKISNPKNKTQGNGININDTTMHYVQLYPSYEGDYKIKFKLYMFNLRKIIYPNKRVGFEKTISKDPFVEGTIDVNFPSN